MKWDYSTPRASFFSSTENTPGSTPAATRRCSAFPPNKLDDLRSPLRFLLGHTELEKEMNSLTLAAAGNGNFTLTGQPKGQEKRIRRLTLTVTPVGTIIAIEIEETDGALTRFTFTGEQPNVAIPADTFHFTPPAGVPVVNARHPSGRSC